MIDDVEGKKHTERISSGSGGGSSTNSNKKQLACVCDLLSSELAFSSERVIRVRARNRCSNFQFRGAISSSFSSFASFFLHFFRYWIREFVVHIRCTCTHIHTDNFSRLKWCFYFAFLCSFTTGHFNLDFETVRGFFPSSFHFFSFLHFQFVLFVARHLSSE